MSSTFLNDEESESDQDEEETLVEEEVTPNGVPKINLPKSLLRCIMGTKLSPPKSNPFGTSKEILKLWKLAWGISSLNSITQRIATTYKVFTRGPWIITDHYLTVRKWHPNFKPYEAEEATTTVWVRFSEFHAEYYSEKATYIIQLSDWGRL